MPESNSKRSIVLLLRGVIVVTGVVIVAWVIWRFLVPPAIALGQQAPSESDSGRRVTTGPVDERAVTTRRKDTTTAQANVVPDLSVTDAGVFAGERFLEHRRSYLRNLRAYQKLEMVEASPDVRVMTDRIAGPLIADIRADPSSARVVESLPAGASDELIGLVSLILSRAAGMERADYDRHWQRDVSLVRPANLASAPEVPDDAENKPVETLYRELYALAAPAPNSPQRITSISIVPSSGFVTAAAEVPTSREGDEVLANKLNKAQAGTFRGLLAASSFVFHQLPDDWPAFAKRHKSVVRFEVAFIVEDGTGDRYPLWISVLYDPDHNRWWPKNVYRMISMRAAQLPKLVF